MPHLLPHPADHSLYNTLLAHIGRHLKAGHLLNHLEVAEREAYVACGRPGGVTSAYVLPYQLLTEPLPGGESLVVYDPLPERNNPGAARPSAQLLGRLTPHDPTGLFAVLPEHARWRLRAQAWQERVRRSRNGESLLGYYTDAERGFHFNEAAKTALRQDATRYLGRVLKHLGWSGIRQQAVTFNPAGPAVSGDAYLHARPEGSPVGVLVQVGGGTSARKVSENGVGIRWCLEVTTQALVSRQNTRFCNHWADFDTAAARLAEEIQAEHARQVPSLPAAS